MKQLSSFLLAAIFVQSLHAAPAVDQAALDRIVNEAMSVWQIPGAAIVVVKDGRIIHARGYGVRELGKTDPVNADTLFAIGSTTKAFTTTAMAMLTAEGKMNWDDPVRRHLNYFRPVSYTHLTLLTICSV